MIHIQASAKSIANNLSVYHTAHAGLLEARPPQTIMDLSL